MKLIKQPPFFCLLVLTFVITIGCEDIGLFDVPKFGNISNPERGYLTADNSLRETKKLVLQPCNELTEYDYERLIRSLAEMTFRVRIGKNKYIKDKDSVYAYLRFAYESGKDFSKGYKVWFFRTNETADHFEYSTQRVMDGKITNGKPIFLVDKVECGSIYNSKYDLIPVPEGNSKWVVDFYNRQL
ncbi:MAG: hypothetical protein LBI42_03655 [Chitinispirillales bacterium]|jgi:hypothetical protein|nr:hypothetical protein [Chitinispirillales bacterium]